jgi:SagB-type dehydrogenase family enzyme
MKKAVFALCMLVSFHGLLFAQEKTLMLPDPEVSGGKGLMEALSLRQSRRDFSESEIPDQILANILWAANGVNRADSGKRTAPSAMGAKEIDIYVARADGLYLYDPDTHALVLKNARDIRSVVGKQGFTDQAPVGLIYVVDYTKFRSNVSKKDRAFYAATDTGFISQNVYLSCASEGLVTVVLGWVDKDALAKTMGLDEAEQVILSQPIGYPKETAER